MDIKKETFTYEGEQFECYTIDPNTEPVLKNWKDENIFTTQLNLPDMYTQLDEAVKVNFEDLPKSEFAISLIYDSLEIQEACSTESFHRQDAEITLEELIENSDLIVDAHIDEVATQNRIVQFEKIIGENNKLTRFILGGKKLVQVLVKILDRNYKVFRFDVDLALQSFNNAHTTEEDYVLTDSSGTGHNDITKRVLKKSFWKNKCLIRNEFLVKLNKKKKNLPSFDVSGKKALILFQGLNKPKVGFYDFLAQKNYLELLQSFYGNEIYLLTYPTWFVNLEDKINTLASAFNAMNLEHAHIDFLCTSTGSVVGRGLLPKLQYTDNIKRLFCINGPNMGTPIANLVDYFDVFVSTISSYALVKASFLSAVLKFGDDLVDEMVGVVDLQGSSVKINEINTLYNSLHRTNDFFIGTSPRSEGPIFDNQENDGVIPVASMLGEVIGGSDYGYTGPLLNVHQNMKMIVSDISGAQKHGKQFKNILLTDFILSNLLGPIA